MKNCIYLLGFVLVFAVLVDSAKILSIFSVPSPSHYIFASALLKKLASRGHEVTSVSCYPQKEPVKNFRDIFVQNNTNIWAGPLKVLENGDANNAYQTTQMLADMFKEMCINIFQHPEFKELLDHPEGKFDLIIVEVIWDDAMFGLGQHFKAPMIGVSTFGTMIGLDDVVGNSSPNSIVPNIYLPLNPKMTIWERIQNFITNLQVFYVANYSNYYVQKVIYDKTFPNAELTMYEAKRNFSVMLLNQHHTLSFPRPYVTNMIEVGGLHIKKKPDPLPKDLQKFLDDATEGVVYFSMGSNLKSKNFPTWKRDIFLNAFRDLKQKVLWKFEDSNIPNKPKNLHMSSWIPQTSVLAHPNVKVFITHGGLLSTTESIHFGKPMLGLPMFFDQARNIENSVSRGLALSLDFPTLTEKELRHALDQLLNNPSYYEKAQITSSHFHAQPMTPMETAVYWVEYVLKYGGDHLRSAGADLNVWQYYSLDVIGILLSAVVFSILLLVWILKTMIRYYNSILTNVDKKIKTK